MSNLPEHFVAVIESLVDEARALAVQSRWGSARQKAEDALRFEPENEQALEIRDRANTHLATLLDDASLAERTAGSESQAPNSGYASYAAKQVTKLAERAAADGVWEAVLGLSTNALEIEPSLLRAQQLRRLARDRVGPDRLHHEPGFLALPLEREFTSEQVERIYAGFQSRSMEEKWNIQARGEYIYFHRSWTGLLHYRVRLEPTQGGARIGEAMVFSNGLAERSLVADASSLEFVILRFLLDEIAH